MLQSFRVWLLTLATTTLDCSRRRSECQIGLVQITSPSTRLPVDSRALLFRWLVQWGALSDLAHPIASSRRYRE